MSGDRPRTVPELGSVFDRIPSSRPPVVPAPRPHLFGKPRPALVAAPSVPVRRPVAVPVVVVPPAPASIPEAGPPASLDARLDPDGCPDPDDGLDFDGDLDLASVQALSGFPDPVPARAPVEVRREPAPAESHDRRRGGVVAPHVSRMPALAEEAASLDLALGGGAALPHHHEAMAALLGDERWTRHLETSASAGVAVVEGRVLHDPCPRLLRPVPLRGRDGAVVGFRLPARPGLRPPGPAATAALIAQGLLEAGDVVDRSGRPDRDHEEVVWAPLRWCGPHDDRDARRATGWFKSGLGADDPRALADPGAREDRGLGDDPTAPWRGNRDDDASTGWWKVLRHDGDGGSWEWDRLGEGDAGVFAMSGPDRDAAIARVLAVLSARGEGAGTAGPGFGGGLSGLGRAAERWWGRGVPGSGVVGPQVPDAWSLWRPDARHAAVVAWRSAWGECGEPGAYGLYGADGRMPGRAPRPDDGRVRAGPFLGDARHPDALSMLMAASVQAYGLALEAHPFSHPGGGRGGREGFGSGDGLGSREGFGSREGLALAAIARACGAGPDPLGGLELPLDAGDVGAEAFVSALETGLAMAAAARALDEGSLSTTRARSRVHAAARLCVAACLGRVRLAGQAWAAGPDGLPDGSGLDADGRRSDGLALWAPPAFDARAVRDAAWRDHPFTLHGGYGVAEFAEGWEMARWTAFARVAIEAARRGLAPASAGSSGGRDMADWIAGVDDPLASGGVHGEDRASGKPSHDDRASGRFHGGDRASGRFHGGDRASGKPHREDRASGKPHREDRASGPFRDHFAGHLADSRRGWARGGSAAPDPRAVPFRAVGPDGLVGVDPHGRPGAPSPDGVPRSGLAATGRRVSASGLPPASSWGLVPAFAGLVPGSREGPGPREGLDGDGRPAERLRGGASPVPPPRGSGPGSAAIVGRGSGLMLSGGPRSPAQLARAAERAARLAADLAALSDPADDAVLGPLPEGVRFAWPGERVDAHGRREGHAAAMLRARRAAFRDADGAGIADPASALVVDALRHRGPAVSGPGATRVPARPGACDWPAFVRPAVEDGPLDRAARGRGRLAATVLAEERAGLPVRAVTAFVAGSGLPVTPGPDWDVPDDHPVRLVPRHLVARKRRRTGLYRYDVHDHLKVGGEEVGPPEPPLPPGDGDGAWVDPPAGSDEVDEGDDGPDVDEGSTLVVAGGAGEAAEGAAEGVEEAEGRALSRRR